MSAKAYWIANNTINDMAGLLRYREANRAVMTRYGAKFIVMHGQQKMVEGQSRENWTVVEFPSYASAVACYEDPEYTAAAEIRWRWARRRWWKGMTGHRTSEASRVTPLPNPRALGCRIGLEQAPRCMPSCCGQSTHPAITHLDHQRERHVTEHRNRGGSVVRCPRTQ